jgi:hypothetical protein
LEERRGLHSPRGLFDLLDEVLVSRHPEAPRIILAPCLFAETVAGRPRLPPAS